MKNIFTLAAVLFAATSFAQTSETTLTGTVTYEKTLANSEDSLPSYRYVVRENISGIEFEALPTPIFVAIGGQVDFKLNIASGSDKMQERQEAFFMLQQSLNQQSQTNNMVSNMQKARHDAMMATIQNTR